MPAIMKLEQQTHIKQTSEFSSGFEDISGGEPMQHSNHLHLIGLQEKPNLVSLSQLKL